MQAQTWQGLNVNENSVLRRLVVKLFTAELDVRTELIWLIIPKLESRSLCMPMRRPSRCCAASGGQNHYPAPAPNDRAELPESALSRSERQRRTALDVITELKNREKIRDIFKIRESVPLYADAPA